VLDQSQSCLAAIAAASRRRHITVVHNPTSGSRNSQRLSQIFKALDANGTAISLHRTAKRGDAEAIAANAATGATDVLVVAGGDGTINEVVNGMTTKTLPIAIFPFGTANVLAAEMNVRKQPERLAATIAAGETRPIHLPTANGRRFVMMAGAGFDAHVVAAVNSRLKRWLGKGAYAVAFAQALWSFPYRGYEVVVDGTSFTAASVVIANGHFYGGRFCLAPDARLDEPDLHVCLFLRSGRWSTLKYALALLLGRLHRRADVKILRCRHVIVNATTAEPVQCDGDIATQLPLTVRMSNETLQCFVPPARWR
jgi:diacylglycerol kinase (ATP)